jgi:hypothetical protein
VLDAVSSPLTRAAYGQALAEFFEWWAQRSNPPFTRAAVHACVERRFRAALITCDNHPVMSQ